MAQGAPQPQPPQPSAEELLEFLVDSARYGDVEDVQQAIALHAPVNGQAEDGRTALHAASANGHTDIVRLLLEANANAHGNTALHWACLSGHLEVVRLLLDHGANGNVENGVGKTPMDEAQAKKFRSIVELMVSHQESTAGTVDVDIEAEEGQPSTANEDAGEVEDEDMAAEGSTEGTAGMDAAAEAVQQLRMQEPAEPTGQQPQAQ